jgi:hypothetical protein
MASNYKRTKTMETDSLEHMQDWKVKTSLSAQEISFLLRKPKIHYRLYKNMKLVLSPFFLNNIGLFSWSYNPLWLYFHGPVAGFILLVFEVSWSHTTTRHIR